MGYSEDMAAFTQYRSGVGDLSDIELAMLIYRMVVGGGGSSPGGGTSGPITIKDGDTANLLDIDAAGRVGINNFPATQAVTSTTLGLESTQSAINAKIPSQDNGRIPVFSRQSVGRKNWTIGAGLTQSNWDTAISDSKLFFLSCSAMSGTSLTVEWRHTNVSSNEARPIVDQFGNPFTLTIGSSVRCFSSDALAPLARISAGDGEIRFVSNAAETVARTITLFY